MQRFEEPQFGHPWYIYLYNKDKDDVLVNQRYSLRC